MGIIAAAVGVAVKALSVKGVLAGIIGSVFKSVISSVILGAISGGSKASIDFKPTTPKFKDQGITKLTREPVANRRIIYGQVKVSGNIIYMSTTSNNRFLHMVIPVASHEIQGVTEVYFNETKVGWDLNTGAVTSGRYAGHAWIYAASTGSDSQTVNADLKANIPGDWTDDHRLRGIAYAYVKLKWNRDIYNDIPNISFLVQGKSDIYDPRDATNKYTDNAALCMLDYLTNSRLGLGITSSEWDSTWWQAEANTCDELVPVSAGGTEKRYTCNGVIETDATYDDNIAYLSTACGGRLTYRLGKFYLYTGVFRAPTLTFTEQDFVGDMTVSTRLSRQELFNSIKGVYISPKTNYEPADYPTVKNSTYISDDNDQIWRELDLRLTNSSSMAQRIAKIELERNRQQTTVATTAKMKAFQVGVGDTIMITDSTMVWTSKVFEVTEWELDYKEGQGGLVVNLGLRETAAGVYNWHSNEETEVDLAPDTNLPSAFEVQTPSGVVLDSGTEQLVRDGGNVVSRIKVSWDAPTDEFVLVGGRVEIEWKKSADTNYGNSIQVDAEDRVEAFIANVEDGVNYDVRVRFINYVGVRGTFNTTTGHTVIGKTENPSNVTNFSVNQNGALVTFKWDQVTDADLSGYEIRFGKQGNTNWTNAQPLSVVTKGTAFTTTSLPAGNHTVFIRAKDTTGNYSTSSGQVSLTVSQAGFTTDTQLDLSNDGWVGTADNFLVHAISNSLVPDSLTQGDDADDIFDNSNIDYHEICRFTFPEIDLGSDKAVRVNSLFYSKLMPDTAGVAAPIAQIRTRLDGEPSNTASLETTNAIQSTGTFSNMVLHHTGALIPDSQDLASVDGTLDEFVKNAFTTCTYESPTFDFGADTIVNLIVETTEELGPGETTGEANVTVEVDYRTAAGSFDGYEEWTSGQFTARYFKVRLTTNTAQGKTVIRTAAMETDNFANFTGVGEYTARYVQIRLQVNTTTGVANITDYNITVDA